MHSFNPSLNEGTQLLYMYMYMCRLQFLTEQKATHVHSFNPSLNEGAQLQSLIEQKTIQRLFMSTASIPTKQKAIYEYSFNPPLNITLHVRSFSSIYAVIGLIQT